MVNAGPTDQTYHIANRLLENGDFQYKIIKNQNYRVSAARNTGMSKARGEYVDGDDNVADELVQNILYIIEHVHPLYVGATT